MSYRPTAWFFYGSALSCLVVGSIMGWAAGVPTVGSLILFGIGQIIARLDTFAEMD